LFHHLLYVFFQTSTIQRGLLWLLYLTKTLLQFFLPYFPLCHLPLSNVIYLCSLSIYTLEYKLHEERLSWMICSCVPHEERENCVEKEVQYTCQVWDTSTSREEKQWSEIGRNKQVAFVLLFVACYFLNNKGSEIIEVYILVMDI
jgi:hypothetical protein